MPELSDPRREAFARECAGGQSLRTAYAAAGYPPSGGAGRIDRRADVIARTAELRARDEALRKADLEETVLAMLDLAASGDHTSAAARKEARAARLDALRLNGLLTKRVQVQSWTPPTPMTEAEWAATYGIEISEPK